MTDSPFEYSKSRIDAAGALIRQGLAERLPVAHEIEMALVVLSSYRTSHLAPMDEVANWLSSWTRTNASSAQVTNRPKREVQIALKLFRKSTMRLSQMSDVAGCRVVADLDDLAALQGALAAKFDVAYTDDYRSEARSTGYRAVHVVIFHRGCRVEVQLRTVVENAWAAWIEDIDRHPSLRGIKDGQSTPELITTTAWVAGRLHAGSMSLSEFDELRRQAREGTNDPN